MIVYKLSEFANDPNLSPKMRKAVDFLIKHKTASLPDGTYSIDGKDVYAQVQTYNTSQPSKVLYEAHKKYVDLQYIAEGKEVINCLNVEDISIVRPYDEKFDILFGLPRLADGIPLKLGTGDFALFFPEHAHAPKLPDLGPSKVKKIVIKISVA